MSDVAAEEITLAELLSLAMDSRLTDLHTAFPAKVEAYHNSTQTVDVVPQLNRSLPDGAGNFITSKLPKLNDVPVCFPRGGGYFVSFPIQAGDYVLVVVSQRNIGNWRATGNQGDPGDLGMHVLDGAVAIPGVFPDSSAIGDSSSTVMRLGKDGTSSAQIELSSSAVLLGGGSQFVALSNKVKAWFDAFNAAVTGWTPVSNDGGAALKVALTALIAGTPTTDVSAANVKAT